jgi:hypothetical protein
MRTKLILLGLLFGITSNVFCQANTVVKFRQLNQEYDFSTKKIKIEIEVINSRQYSQNSNVPLTFELICTNITDDSFFGITKTKGLSIIIEPTEQNIDIEFPINEKVLEKNKYLTFVLKKKGINKNFEIFDSGHTVVLLPKNYNKSIVGIEKLKDFTKLNINLDDLESIKVPFNISVNGDAVNESDNVTAQVSINGKNKKEFKFYGNKTKSEFIIKRVDNKKEFDLLINTITEKESFVLNLTKITAANKKNYEVNKKKDSILIEVKKIDKPKARYDLFLGTNFDLKDRFEATSFYSEISAFLPEVYESNDKSTVIGLRGGIYKNNNSINLEESRRQETLLQVENISTDSISYSEKRVNTIPKVEIENLGLFFEVLLRAIESKDKKFRGYFSIRAEMVERREKYTYNSTDLFSLGQNTIALDSLSNNTRLQNDLARPNNYIRKYYDSYYGVGFPMFYTAGNKDFEIFFNPVYGIGYPGLILAREEDVLKRFGAFQFHIVVSDSNILGIKLGGEVRKYFGFEQAPLININLSTRNNLSGALKKEKD